MSFKDKSCSDKSNLAINLEKISRALFLQKGKPLAAILMYVTLRIMKMAAQLNTATLAQPVQINQKY